MSYNDMQWLPLTVGLTALGLILSYLAYRRRGLRPAMMGAAWSLLPIAAYLTGATEMLWKIGAAIGKFGSGFVFSPEKWAGIGVTGLAVALFLAAGGRQARKAAREARKAARDARRDEATGTPAAPALEGSRSSVPATRALSTERKAVPVNRGAAKAPGKAARQAPPPPDDDLKDIEDILRKRGI